MNAHRELLKLHNDMTSAEDKALTHFVDTGAVPLAFLCTGIGLAFIGGFTLMNGGAVMTVTIGLFVLAAAFMIASPIINHLIQKKASELKLRCRSAEDAYVNALHKILDFNGFKGEYVAHDHPSTTPYACFAEKDGKIVSIKVTLYRDGLISDVEGQRINLTHSM